MAEIKAQGANPESTTKIFKYFVIALVLGVILSFLISLYHKYGNGVGNAEQYELVETITCNPNEALWAENGGWCSSQALSPGQYQMSLVSWDLRLVTGSGLKVTGSEVVPEAGIPLSRWSGQPYEQQFRREAPNGKFARVAAPLYRIGAGEASYLSTQSFTLTRESRVKVGVNILPTAGAYTGNRGGMVVEIKRLATVERPAAKEEAAPQRSGGFLSGLMSVLGVICLLLILGFLGWWGWTRFSTKSPQKK